MKSKLQAFELFEASTKENKVLAGLSDDYLTLSEMSDEERQFLSALVLRKQPKKLLEIGVSAGSSSVILLNAIKDISNAALHSIDYATDYYLDNTKKTGFVVDGYTDLSSKWKLYTGGLALEYMDKIGDGIDFCFIDAAHMNPGEILDTLMVLPYLKDDAIIVYHDVNLPTFVHKVTYDINRTLTNNLLMSAVHGKKIILKNFKWGKDSRTHFPNMGAIQLNTNSKAHVFEIFNLLTLKWSYLPTKSEEETIIKFFAKHYDKYPVDYTRKCFEYQRSRFKVSTTEKAKKFLKSAVIRMIGQNRYESLITKALRS